jgi:hypothetical protein
VTSKTQIVLDAIHVRGGMTFKEIQRLAIMMAGKDPDDRANRGYWSDRIADIAREWLVRGEDKRYRIANVPGVERPPTYEELLADAEFIGMFDDERRSDVRLGRLGARPFATHPATNVMIRLEKDGSTTVRAWGVGLERPSMRIVLTPEHVNRIVSKATRVGRSMSLRPPLGRIAHRGRRLGAGGVHAEIRRAVAADRPGRGGLT